VVEGVLVAETLYGRNVVLEALRAGHREHRAVTIADTAGETGVIEEILELCRETGVPVAREGRACFAQLGGVNHQGVALETSPFPYGSVEDMLTWAEARREPPCLLLLDLLQDPQNVGSLVRTAEAVGVHGVIVQRRRGVGVTPAVVRASSGAVEHLVVARVTNLVHQIQRLKQADVWVAGLENLPRAQLYWEADLSGPIALVVGGEGKGLRRLVRGRCDFLLRLPMAGRVSSVNASVAGSVVLYEAFRQRRGTFNCS
jgi:23S rRNA (guanosine2251-2'-O)-methyltransferase